MARTGSHPRLVQKSRARIAILVTSVTTVLILAATLTPGDPRLLEPTSIFCLVCGSRGLVDVLLNLGLFVPFGAARRLAGTGARRTAVSALLLSLAVEATQYALLVGRDASLSDLLTNTGGALIGWALLARAPQWLAPSPSLAPRLATAWWLIWLGTLGVGAWGLQPDPAPPTDAVAMLLPPSGRYRAFEGIVREPRLAGTVASPVLAGSALRDALAAPVLEMSAWVRPAYPPGLTRPIVFAFGREDHELALLAQRRRELRFVTRTNAARIRLQNLEVALPGAFPRAPGGDPRRAPEVHVAGRRTPTHVELDATGPAGTRRLVVPLSPNLTWTFVAPFDLRYDRRGPLRTALWLGGWLLPLGYWAGRGGRGPGGAALLGLAIILPMLAVPALAGFAPVPRWEWIAAMLGASLGWTAAVASRYADARRAAASCRAPAPRPDYAS
ncbi:MAG TPA: VanZ family protein [Gemmatimonadaceae bacterium]|nr:VanZ family protein [Gemmatimonadaceae bacterium]